MDKYKGRRYGKRLGLEDKNIYLSAINRKDTEYDCYGIVADSECNDASICRNIYEFDKYEGYNTYTWYYNEPNSMYAD
jgi:hypothetical protein